MIECAHLIANALIHRADDNILESRNVCAERCDSLPIAIDKEALFVVRVVGPRKRKRMSYALRKHDIGERERNDCRDESRLIPR